MYSSTISLSLGRLALASSRSGGRSRQRGSRDPRDLDAPSHRGAAPRSRECRSRSPRMSKCPNSVIEGEVGAVASVCASSWNGKVGRSPRAARPAGLASAAASRSRLSCVARVGNVEVEGRIGGAMERAGDPADDDEVDAVADRALQQRVQLASDGPRSSRSQVPLSSRVERFSPPCLRRTKSENPMPRCDPLAAE